MGKFLNPLTFRSVRWTEICFCCNDSESLTFETKLSLVCQIPTHSLRPYIPLILGILFYSQNHNNTLIHNYRNIHGNKTWKCHVVNMNGIKEKPSTETMEARFVCRKRSYDIHVWHGEKGTFSWTRTEKNCCFIYEIHGLWYKHSMRQEKSDKY